jgi:hypothetical protein
MLQATKAANQTVLINITTNIASTYKGLGYIQFTPLMTYGEVFLTIKD